MESLLTGHPTAIFWRKFHYESESVQGVYSSRLIDVRNGSVTPVPDSKDTLGPWYATQDTLIAVANEQSKLVRYNFKTRKWSELS